MTGRVILFGATGFTGRLAAEAMVRAGLAPVLAGRSADALVAVTGDLAGLGPIDAPPTWQVADAADPESVRALIGSRDDVLVSTVGPFARLGGPAVHAAIEQGCCYLDSTGEGPFIRRLFEEDGPRAEVTGARLLPAFGYDDVPGNLAGALAIREARDRGRIPVSVEIGYFVRGPMELSSGTRASVASMVGAAPFARRNGRIAEGANRVMRFDVAGSSRDGLLVGASEPFALARLDPGVRDVGVYLGWAGRWTRGVQVIGDALLAGSRLPLLGPMITAGVGRAVGDGTGHGPTATQRAASATVVVARASDGVGRELSSVRVEGPSPYDLTAELLAWGAAMMHTGRTLGSGTLGPADAFGVDALVEGCATMGLRRVD